MLRADKHLKKLFPSLTKRHIAEAFKKAWIRDTKNRPLKKGSRLSKHTPINAEKLKAHIERLEQGNPAIKVTILLEASDYVVIDKPAGIASQPISLFEEDSLSHWALVTFPEVRNHFDSVQPEFTPHRLDIGTSGCQVLCKTPQSFIRWREFFSNHRVHKTYLAWCWGQADFKTTTTSLPIAHHSKDKTKMITVDSQTPYRMPLREASSHVEVIKQLDDRFLCKVSCHSGVTHQVRVHLASLGHPLLGDETYDDNLNKRTQHPPYHLLRACSLRMDAFTISAPTTEFESLYH